MLGSEEFLDDEIPPCVILQDMGSDGEELTFQTRKGGETNKVGSVGYSVLCRLLLAHYGLFNTRCHSTPMSPHCSRRCLIDMYVPTEYGCQNKA